MRLKDVHTHFTRWGGYWPLVANDLMRENHFSRSHWLYFQSQRSSSKRGWPVAYIHLVLVLHHVRQKAPDSALEIHMRSRLTDVRLLPLLSVTFQERKLSLLQYPQAGAHLLKSRSAQGPWNHPLDFPWGLSRRTLNLFLK